MSSSSSSSSSSAVKNDGVGITNNNNTTTTSTTSTPPISIVNNKMTPAQQSSLLALKAHLTCALCAQPYGRASTTTTNPPTATSNTDTDEHEPAILMACMHTFCRSCITTHMENDWQCPLPNCRKSVTNFGGSSEVIKTNPIYCAVSKSLAEMERIMKSAPDYWWLSQCNTTTNNSKMGNDTEEEEEKREHDDGENVDNEKDDDNEDEEEMEVVDFTHYTVNTNSNQGTNNNNYDNNHTNNESSISKCKEHTTTTAFRTESTEGSEYFIQEPGKGGGGGGEELLIPEFIPYCSPIPIRGSEIIVALSSPTRTNNYSNDDDDDDDDEGKGGTATASQLDRVLHHNQPSSTSKLLLSSSSSSLVVLSTSHSATIPAGAATTTTTTTAAAHTDKKKKKKRNGVTFQTQPKILPLIPTSKWNTEHSRQLRKWITDGRASLLHIDSSSSGGSSSSSILGNNNSGGGVDDEGGFNFDDEGVAESFLSLLSSSASSSKNDDDDDDDDAAAAVPIMSYYAISTKKDPNFSFDKSVIVVPRSFMYYLVVACGLPIVDVDFLSAAAAAAALNQRGQRNSQMSISTTTTGGQRYPFPTNNDPHYIQGATNHTWGAPIKARLAALERYTVGPCAMSNVLRPGTDLLCKYIVILIGDYDQPALSSSSSQQIRGKRKRGGGQCPANNGTMNAEDDIGYRTRGNVSILLRLCGAMVYDVSQIASSKLIQKGLNEDQLSTIMNTMSSGGYTIHNNNDSVVPALKDILVNSNKRGVYNESSINLDHPPPPPPTNLLVMVKDELDIPTVGHKFVNKIMKMENNNLNVIPIVSSDWLFNSIGEFQVQSVTMKKNEGLGVYGINE